jgi:hypothetical protein
MKFRKNNLGLTGKRAGESFLARYTIQQRVVRHSLADQQ